MWDLTQEAVDQRWEALIRPLARRRRIRHVLWLLLTPLSVIAIGSAAWALGIDVLPEALHSPAFGLRP